MSNKPIDEDAIDEDGYVSEEDRVRKCQACVKREEDEDRGVSDDGEEP